MDFRKSCNVETVQYKKKSCIFFSFFSGGKRRSKRSYKTQRSRQWQSLELSPEAREYLNRELFQKALQVNERLFTRKKTAVSVEKRMQNLTETGNQTTTAELFCSSTPTEPKTKIIISAINIPLCITAFLGNLLIIIAVLPKVSSLHPPSKLLLGCLACTDLCVGLVWQPLYVILLLSSQLSKLCYYAKVLF